MPLRPYKVNPINPTRRCTTPAIEQPTQSKHRLERSIKLPSRERLEEVNLPAELAQRLAGQTVQVTVYPEEAAFVRKVDDIADGVPALIPSITRLVREGCIVSAGGTWNDAHPTIVTFATGGQVWRLPRHWLQDAASQHIHTVEIDSNVYVERQFPEALHLPSKWDLEDINIFAPEAEKAGGRPTHVTVTLRPGQPVKVEWRDPAGTVWRIPHDWRRRRVLLPGFAVLVGQGIPEDVAHEFCGRAVSVNYHPGSLCCLPDGYRFRDESGNRYEVRQEDCVVLGYGDEAEAFA